MEHIILENSSNTPYLDLCKAFFTEDDEDFFVEYEDQRVKNMNFADLATERLPIMDDGEIVPYKILRSFPDPRTRHVCFNAKMALALLRNTEYIPSEWKKKVDGNLQTIIFDGTVFRVDGARRVIAIEWANIGWRLLLVWGNIDWRGRKDVLYAPNGKVLIAA